MAKNKPIADMGDSFDTTLIIVDIVTGETGYEYRLLDKATMGEVVNEYFTEKDLRILSDPNYAERLRLEEIQKLEQRLEELQYGVT